MHFEPESMLVIEGQRKRLIPLLHTGAKIKVRNKWNGYEVMAEVERHVPGRLQVVIKFNGTEAPFTLQRVGQSGVYSLDMSQVLILEARL